MLFMLCFEAADWRRTLAACVSLSSSQPSYEPLSLVHPTIAFFSTTELDVMAIENTNNTFQIIPLLACCRSNQRRDSRSEAMLKHCNHTYHKNFSAAAI